MNRNTQKVVDGAEATSRGSGWDRPGRPQREERAGRDAALRGRASQAEGRAPERALR